MLTFLNPWALAIGGLALAAPLAIHFLTRPKPQPLPLSTIRFVWEAISEQKSRQRLRDFLVLLLRVLAIALLAAAMARPFLRQTVVDPETQQASVARVIILDTSLSMSAGRGGGQPIERARGVADRYLRYSNGLTAGLVTVGARAESVFDELSINLAALRQRVMQAQAVDQAADVPAAIRRAGELLATAGEGTQLEVVVISDFQRGNWGVARFQDLPAGTRVQLESVALEESINTAIVAARFAPRIVVGKETTIEVEIQHRGSEQTTGTCALRIGPWTAEREVTIDEGRTTIAMSILPDQSGWFGGVAQWRGHDDVLPRDDRRPVVMQVADMPRVLLLSGESSALRPSAGYYLQSALQTVYGDATEDGAAGMKRVSTAELTEADLIAADVIIVDHPGRLKQDQAAMIARLTRRGRGLLYVISDVVDGANTLLLADQLKNDWQLPVNFLSPRGQRPRKEMVITDVQRKEPPFAIFGDQLTASLAAVRLSGGLPTEMTEGNLRDRVSAWLEDRSAWIASAPCGSGRITLLNCDLGQSNLATQPAFLPILAQLVESLLPRESDAPAVDCGEAMTRALDASVSIEDALTVAPVRPWTANERGYGQWEASAGGVLWRWPAPDQIGAFEVLRAGRAVGAIAIQTPAVESELTSLSADAFTENLSGQATVGFRNARSDDDQSDRWWNWLAILCLLAMVGEFTVLRAMRN